MTLTISINMSASSLTRDSTRDEIMDFILDLDSEIAEADFTETLILKLATALAADSKTSTMVEIGNKIAALQGYTP